MSEYIDTPQVNVGSVGADEFIAGSGFENSTKKSSNNFRVTLLNGANGTETLTTDEALVPKSFSVKYVGKSAIKIFRNKLSKYYDCLIVFDSSLQVPSLIIPAIFLSDEKEIESFIMYSDEALDISDQISTMQTKLSNDDIVRSE